MEGLRVLAKRRGVDEREMDVGIKTLEVRDAAIAIAFGCFCIIFFSLKE